MTLHNLFYHPVTGKINSLTVLLLALVPAIVLFPFPVSVFSNGIDPPLAWVFNYLVQGNIATGKNIIFPHGPLAFLMYPLPVEANLWVATLTHLLLRIFLAYSLIKLTTYKPSGWLIFALASAFIMLSINDILLTLVQIIALCYLNFFERRNVTWLIPALILTAIAVYIKAFVGIVGFLITLSFAGIMIYRSIIGLESKYRLLLFLIVPFCILLIWIVLYGNLDGIAGYFKGMSELAGDNSAAVAVYPNNNWWLISSGILSGLLLFILNLKNKASVRFTILVAPALFAIWKYGMAREDFQHASVLFITILFIALIYKILSDKFKLINSFLTITIIGSFYFSLQNANYFEPFHIKANGIQTIFEKASNYQYFSDTCNLSSEKSISRNKLDGKILKLIGQHTVDIYPWDYTYIAANNLNWQPRPVLQSYASYTQYLDQLNARHFESEKAPAFLIWELRKITHDIHGGTLESIDGRYLLNDEPDALISLLRNYSLVATQNGTFPVLIYQKRAQALKSENKVLNRATVGWNTWIDVPENQDEILRAGVEMKRSNLGKLKSFFYKDEAVFAYYLLKNGDIRTYRIVPKNAAYGLWVKPLIMNPEDKTLPTDVVKIMFRCTNTKMMDDTISITWNSLHFNDLTPKSKGDGETVNVINQFFGIKAENQNKELLVSQNKLEENLVFWSNPDESSIVKTLNNRTLQLLPDKYSVSFEYPLDSLSVSDSSTDLNIRTGVWARAKLGAKAIYVISIEKNGKSLIWKAVDIQGFIHDKNTMNFVTNFSVLEAKMLKQKGLNLKVYLWNTGRVPILLEDFSVRIEGK
ncbi:MAG: hypothetical protein ACOYN4_03340 [Bacteroidales bacterium]